MKWILISFVASIAAAADIGVISSKNDTIYFGETPLHLEPDWKVIVAIDISRGDECPSSFAKVQSSGKVMCGTSSYYGCSSHIYPLHGFLYNEIAGAIRGYQKGTTDAFQASSHGKGINDAYVDGISITIGNPRQHVWTVNYPDYPKRELS